MSKKVFDTISGLVTEARNDRTASIDALPVEEVLALINAEDRTVADCVAGELPHIAAAVKHIIDAFQDGGRLIYIGAGTSGRLGVLDASECPPTFGTDPGLVVGLIAGGPEALVRSREGVEDRYEQGRHDLETVRLTAADVVCGIAASRRTPYVLGGLAYARETGAKTVLVTCNPRVELDIPVDVAICPVVGPEVIMGSTRMKAGTATKLVLNMLTTASMIRMGKVYENMMVDLKMTSEKLEERSKRTVMMVTGIGYAAAEETLERAGGHVKTALVMHLGGVDAKTAQDALGAAGGFVRDALQRISNDS